MAMDATTLADLIKSKADTKMAAVADELKGDAMLEAIAEAIVEHIQSAATLDGEVLASDGTATGQTVSGGVQ